MWDADNLSSPLSPLSVPFFFVRDPVVGCPGGFYSKAVENAAFLLASAEWDVFGDFSGLLMGEDPILSPAHLPWS